MTSRLFLIACVISMCFSVGNAQETAPAPANTEGQPEPVIALKDAFKEPFRVGVAVNRSVTTGQAFRRSQEDLTRDIALVKQHFNHVVAENEMKWQLIHPRPGADGFDFGPGDALIAFATSNNMEVAGHTLVWHSQTPNWVFEGTHQPAENVRDVRPRIKR